MSAAVIGVGEVLEEGEQAEKSARNRRERERETERERCFLVMEVSLLLFLFFFPSDLLVVLQRRDGPSLCCFLSPHVPLLTPFLSSRALPSFSRPSFLLT